MTSKIISYANSIICLMNAEGEQGLVLSMVCQRRSKTAPAGRSKSAPAWMSF